MKLPYEFDLLFDIKSLEHLHEILEEDSFDAFTDPVEVEILMDKYNILFPKGYDRRSKKGFHHVVWIDKHGGYLTQEPPEEEKENFQRMRIF